MRVAFAGSPEAAVEPLRALARSAHEVTMVVSQPDRPRGRRGTPTPTPVAAAALELGLPVVRPRTINDPDVIAQIRDSGAEALAVVAFGQILREGVLDAWPCVNVHFSLLPAYRGAAPVERALMDGVEETGVTIMAMEAGLDTGPVYAVERTPVGPDEDAGALVARLSEMGGPLLVQVLSALEAGTAVATPQPEEGVTYAAKIAAEDRPLDPARPAAELARRVRALSPHIGATCRIGGEPFKVWRAVAHADAAAPGLADVGGRLVGGTAEGSLEILELQPPGRGRMDAGSFLRGWRGGLTWDPS